MTANFIFVSNDKYVKNLGICSYSVMHNMCPEMEHVRLFVMDCGINQENKNRLLKQAARFENAEMIFFDIQNKLDSVMPKVPTTWNRAIYGRLFLTELLSVYDDIDRLIYLDCDLLMDRPVTELFTVSLDGKCIAGVTDGDDTPRKNALGIDPEYTYVNSGVLVIDTARWTKLNASDRIIAYINSFTHELLYPDQDAINYILHDEIKVLEPVYNMMWMLCERDIPKMISVPKGYHYTAEQTSRALYHGSIYHYAGRNMWTFYGITPVHAIIFKKYRRLCDWRNERRRFGGFQNFALWLGITAKRVLIGEMALTRRKMKEEYSSPQ